MTLDARALLLQLWYADFEIVAPSRLILGTPTLDCELAGEVGARESESGCDPCKRDYRCSHRHHSVCSL